MATSNLSTLPPFRVKPVFSERIWGRHGLSPWYPEASADVAIGEAWLTGPASVIETGPLAGSTLAQAVAARGDAILGSPEAGDFPLLVKMLFPEEKLSVQVHPDDAAAQLIGQPRGKTECWYVLEAEPGATVALGLHPGVTAEALRAAAADKSLESLLQWLPVSVGDMIYVDAGTVHAIGPGLVLLEIQQTSDTTYRVYDYGRPRELHLEAALGVIKTNTAAGKIAPVSSGGSTRLIAQRYFAAYRHDLGADRQVNIELRHLGGGTPGCIIALKGSVAILSEGAEAVDVSAGRAAIIPASCDSFTVKAQEAASFVYTFAPRDKPQE